jgi:hypothetical protein
MKRRNKLDPQVAKVMNAVASQSNSKKIHISLTVGKRVVCYADVTPKTTGDYCRILANRSAADSDLTAISCQVENNEGELCAQMFLDGKVLTYGHEPFGRVIEHAILRINGKYADKICTPEGLTEMLSKEL